MAWAIWNVSSMTVLNELKKCVGVRQQENINLPLKHIVGIFFQMNKSVRTASEQEKERKYAANTEYDNDLH